VGGALDAIRTRIFDAAFLDIDLNGASALQVAAALRQKTIPFAFISGNAHAVSKDFEHVSLVDKPFEPSVVEAFARNLCGLSEHGVD
jgi:CheY-like chemotaxis protein